MMMLLSSLVARHEHARKVHALYLIMDQRRVSLHGTKIHQQQAPEAAMSTSIPVPHGFREPSQLCI